MNELLDAIVADDRARVASLLCANGSLATRFIDTATLYETGVFHHIYVGDTALHLAAAGYRVEIAQMLLDAGADVNTAKNHRRGRPLHYAADGYVGHPAWNPQRQVETLALLIAGNADIDVADQNGATALHRAVRTRCAAAALYLLSAGANPASRNKSGSTPFHLAVQNTGRGGSGDEIALRAQRQIIEGFLACGVSTGLEDGKGRPVRDSAQSAWARDALQLG